MRLGIRTVRQVLDLVLVLLVVVVLAVVLAANLAPGLGHQLIVIRGGSMSPAIPLGAVVDIVRVTPDSVRPGDVVSYKLPNGVLVTHRVVAVVAKPDGTYLQVKGDANEKPDPVLVTPAELSGRVFGSMPYAGYLMYMLSIPTGIASIFLLAATLLLSIWLLEELEQDPDEDEEVGADETDRAPEVAPGPAPELGPSPALAAGITTEESAARSRSLRPRRRSPKIPQLEAGE